MSCLSFTIPVDDKKAKKTIIKKRKPSRMKTAIALGLIFIWLLLITFAVVAATNPSWLRNISKFGRTDESSAMKEYADNFLRQRDYRMAIAHYRRALEIRPAFVEALVGIAVAYNLSGNGEQGLRILQDALNLASNRSGMIYFNIAEILERQGKKKQAIEHYLKSLDSEVDQDWVYHKLGVLYYETNQYEYARIAFEKALQIRTDPVTPYLKMIKLNLVLYENDKDHLPVIEQMLKNNINAEALEDFDLETIEKINKSDPEVAKTHNYLGAIDAIQGDTGKAIEHFRQSQQIWPDGIDARKNLQLLTQKK